MEKELQGTIQVIASGYLSYEIFNAKADFLHEIISFLNREIGACKTKQPLVGLDGVYIDCFILKSKLVLGWDIWSGCFIMSDSKEADEMVREIGKRLDEKLVGINRNKSSNKSDFS